ncbi:corticoliberin-like [Arapaima gigas]
MNPMLPFAIHPSVTALHMQSLMVLLSSLHKTSVSRLGCPLVDCRNHTKKEPHYLLRTQLSSGHTKRCSIFSGAARNRRKHLTTNTHALTRARRLPGTTHSLHGCNSDLRIIPDMKLSLLASSAVLLVALLPPYECRAIENQGAQPAHGAGAQALPQQSLPLLVRLGEEYFVRLGNLNQNPPVVPSDIDASSSSSSSSSTRKALQLELTQRLLQGKLDSVGRLMPGYGSLLDDSAERGKRSEEPPISLDLTFHLLREVLEMARAEQLAQQAHSNRKMMELVGK